MGSECLGLSEPSDHVTENTLWKGCPPRQGSMVHKHVLSTYSMLHPVLSIMENTATNKTESLQTQDLTIG